MNTPIGNPIEKEKCINQNITVKHDPPAVSNKIYLVQCFSLSLCTARCFYFFLLLFFPFFFAFFTSIFSFIAVIFTFILFLFGKWTLSWFVFYSNRIHGCVYGYILQFTAEWTIAMRIERRMLTEDKSISITNKCMARKHLAYKKVMLTCTTIYNIHLSTA